MKVLKSENFGAFFSCLFVVYGFLVFNNSFVRLSDRPTSESVGSKRWKDDVPFEETESGFNIQVIAIYL